MHRLATLRHGCHRLDHTVGHVERMRADEPYALDAVHTGHRRQQISESISFIPVGIYRLPQQCDFPCALRNTIADFTEYLIERMVDLTAAHKRNDAIRAGIVASPHDGHESSHSL